MYWKTSFCCLSDGDADDDDEALMILWVLCPDEEDEETQEGTKGEVKVICFCREEALEALSLPQQAETPAVWVFHLFYPSLFPPSCLCHCSHLSPLRQQAEKGEVDVEDKEDDDPLPPS